MKPVLIVYATREGHTRRIAEHSASRLQQRGFRRQLVDAANPPAGLDLQEYSGVLIAASLHGQLPGHSRAAEHEREMVRFVKEHRADLAQLPTAFVSVSMTEAGAENAENPPYRRAEASLQVKEAIDRFFHEVGWHADQVQPVAGALPYSKYGLLRRFAAKLVAKRTGGDTDSRRDYVYTDWTALNRFIAEFAVVLVDSVPRSVRTPSVPPVSERAVRSVKAERAAKQERSARSEEQSARSAE